VKYVIMLIFMLFIFEGIGQAIFHNDVYDARKQEELSAFQEYAIPPNSIEVGDDSYEKFKTIAIIKKYQVTQSQEELEKYYEEKMTLSGWEKIENKEGVHYRKDDFAIFIEYRMPIVEVCLLYIGDDKGM